MKHCEVIPGLEAENRAIRETFEHFHDLDVLGGAIVIKDHVEAITIGETLNEKTAIIHFQKANPKIPGLYQVINHWFARTLLQPYQYVNQEQELAIPGLQGEKNELYPCVFYRKNPCPTSDALPCSSICLKRKK